MNHQDRAEAERIHAILNTAIADGLLPVGTVIGGRATPTQIVEAAMAASTLYAGVRTLADGSDWGPDMLEIAEDDLTWRVLLEDVEDRVSDMQQGLARDRLERLVELRAAVAPQEESNHGRYRVPRPSGSVRIRHRRIRSCSPRSSPRIRCSSSATAEPARRSCSTPSLSPCAWNTATTTRR